ncbi:MAG: threonine-phosphate decarboxylase CobD [Haloferacaceae archaeon]
MDPDSVPGVDRVPHGGADDPSLLDFSANTNPERPDGVAAVYDDALDAAGRYPDDDYPAFRAAAAAYVDCPSHQVVPTAGGLQAIRLALGVAVVPGDTALLPAPSFGEYAREVRLQGGEPTFVPHDAVLDADPAGHAVAVVCHPNNPTGTGYGDDALRAFADRCRESGTPLLVDEAFLDFTDRPSLAGTPGVVVARSLTKVFGLPGLRVGFAVATGGLRDRLETARPAWGLSTPAAAVGAHCLDCRSFVERIRERVRTERERMRAALDGPFDVRPSVANFLLLDVGDRSVDALRRRARERGVVVRDATTFRDLDSHVRVAVRRPDENDRLLAALDADADAGGIGDHDP